MCLANVESQFSSQSSKTTKNKSKRDIIGADKFIFALNDLVRSYLP